MALHYYLYGEVAFQTAQRRTQAQNRLDTRLATSTFVAEVWDMLLVLTPNWPAGRADITMTDDSQVSRPGFRFCYRTNSADEARAAAADLPQWNVWGDSNSFWGFAAAN